MRQLDVLRLPLLLVCALVTLACAGSDDVPLADELRTAFPQHAPLVLESASSFKRSAAGDAFVGAEPSLLNESLPEHLRLEGVFPIQGDDAVRLRLGDGFEARVREVGAYGDAELAVDAIAYRREGGALFWTKTDAGYEEWLLLEPGQARPDRAAAAWTLEGATARQEGDVVLVLDDDGRPRLRVASPLAFAASGRPLEARLFAAGSHRIELYVDGSGERVLVDPSWTPTAALLAGPRYGPRSTRLATGNVLHAGGTSLNSKHVLLAELYDPTTDVWAPSGMLASPTEDPTMTLLPNGKVLIAGGIQDLGNTTEWLALTQIYNPATKTWTQGPPMNWARHGHTATVLSNGKVLVAGGADSLGLLATTEIYDPAMGTWKPAAPMNLARAVPQATLLPNGKVLVAGGAISLNTTPTKSVEIYDPIKNTWTIVASMNLARIGHCAALLPNGKVLVVANEDHDPSDGFNVTPEDAEIYDPDTNTWTPTSLMPQRAVGVTLTMLLNGKAFLTHRESTPEHQTFAQIYDPVADLWTITKPPAWAHYIATATLLENGKVLLVGGVPSDPPPFPEIYDPGAATGAGCATGDGCETGFCVGGVCCDSACDASGCEVCAVAAGATADGACTKLSGVACDDGDACTLADTCEAGACGGAPRTCEAIDECHAAGACDSATGLCVSPPLSDGAACAGGGVCKEGHCVPEGGASSASGTPQDPSAPGGCGCRMTSSARGAGSAFALLLLVGALRRRWRVRSAGGAAQR